MRPAALGKALDRSIGEPDTINVLGNRAVFGRREISPTAGVVDAIERTDFPFAVGQLPDELSVVFVKIKMPPTVSCRLPNGGSVIYERRIVVYLDPRWRLLPTASR